jgi:hypothetical protein
MMPLDKYRMGEMTWPELKQTVAEGRIAVVRWAVSNSTARTCRSTPN